VIACIIPLRRKAAESGALTLFSAPVTRIRVCCRSGSMLYYAAASRKRVKYTHLLIAQFLPAYAGPCREVTEVADITFDIF